MESPRPMDAPAYWARALADQRRVWERKRSLRHAYEGWFGEIAGRIGDRRPVVEVGSGSGGFKEAVPRAVALDYAPVPWIDVRADALALPLRDGSVGALVLVDVLHHLLDPQAFFREATRVLKPSGRLLLLEPFVTPFSFPVYRFVHPEGLPGPGDPWRPDARPRTPGEPYSNQRACKEIFWREAGAFADRFPGLRIADRRLLGFLGYCLSGGFSGPDLWPRALFGPLDLLDRAALALAPRIVAMRALVTLERAPGAGVPAQGLAGT